MGRRVRVPPGRGFTDAWYIDRGWYIVYDQYTDALALMNFKTIKGALGKPWTSTNTSG